VRHTSSSRRKINTVYKQAAVFFTTAVLFCSFGAQNSFANSFIAGGVRLKKNVKPLREVKRQNVVTQSLDFSCGAAGLSTLLNYYLDDPVSEAEIINSLLNTVPLEKIKERKGFSLLDLKAFAESKGYKVTGYKMDIEFLREQKKPVLVPISFRKYHHFVIVKAVVADRVFIADPAAGNMTMKIDKFNQIWTNGIALLIEKEGEENRNYALKPEEQDVIIAHYDLMKRVIDQKMLRTNVFPGEF